MLNQDLYGIGFTGDKWPKKNTFKSQLEENIKDNDIKINEEKDEYEDEVRLFF